MPYIFFFSQKKKGESADESRPIPNSINKQSLLSQSHRPRFLLHLAAKSLPERSIIKLGFSFAPIVDQRRICGQLRAWRRAAPPAPARRADRPSAGSVAALLASLTVVSSPSLFSSPGSYAKSPLPSSNQFPVSRYNCIDLQI